MIQVCMKHIVSHILYGLSLFLVSRDICLLCDYEMSICLLQKLKPPFPRVRIELTTLRL